MNDNDIDGLAYLTENLAKECRANSERWFPDLHSRAPGQILLHYALGLGGEVGELLNKIKKVNRYGGPIGSAMMEEIAGEISDVLIYLLLMADELGINPIQASVIKIAQNEERFGAG